MKACSLGFSCRLFAIGNSCTIVSSLLHISRLFQIILTISCTARGASVETSEMVKNTVGIWALGWRCRMLCLAMTRPFV